MSDSSKTFVEVAGVKFGEHRDALFEIESENFISKQPERFALLEGEECHTGTLYFCKSYLEACFVRALFDGIGLYIDDRPMSDLIWVVASKKVFPRKDLDPNSVSYIGMRPW